MYRKQQPLEYNPDYGSWEFTLPKTHKDIFSQAGLKIVIDPGYPTGYNGDLWSTKNNGLSNPTISFRGYDNVSGWVSYAKFSLPQFLEALIKLVPKNAVETKTYNITLNDLKIKEKENG